MTSSPLTQEQINKLYDIGTRYKNTILVEINKLINGIRNRDYFFLKMIQSKVPFLNMVVDENLVKIGNEILDNLKIIKTYNGLSKILTAIYGETNIIYTPKAGQIGVDINYDIEKNERGFLVNEKLWINKSNKIITSKKYRYFQNNGILKVFLTRSGKAIIGKKTKKILVIKGYFEINNINYQQFINNFVLAGVHIEKIDIENTKKEAQNEQVFKR